jgi:hypothetical protein
MKDAPLLRSLGTSSADLAGVSLFLYDISRRELHGVYTPVGLPGFPLDPTAWTSTTSQSQRAAGGGSSSKLTPFAAQIRVRPLRPRVAPLHERDFANILTFDTKYHFSKQLDASQVRRLLHAFSFGGPRLHSEDAKQLSRNRAAAREALGS